MDQNDIAEYITKTPPSCVRSFQLAPTCLPEKCGEVLTTTWRLRCSCGGDIAKLIGYPLKDLNADYAGGDFVSPLAFECSRCQQITEIFNTTIHGYHAEIAKIEGGTSLVKHHGTGTRAAFVCPTCAMPHFQMIVGFVYWDFDIVLDEPELPAQEFFNEFLLYCECVNCNRNSKPTHFGKL
jgi:hypothetical protein